MQYATQIALILESSPFLSLQSSPKLAPSVAPLYCTFKVRLEWKAPKTIACADSAMLARLRYIHSYKDPLRSKAQRIRDRLLVRNDTTVHCGANALWYKTYGLRRPAPLLVELYYIVSKCYVLFKS